MAPCSPTYPLLPRCDTWWDALCCDAKEFSVRQHTAHTSTPDSIPSARPYDAKAIIHDFQAHGLPLDQLQYGATINDYVGKDYVTVITLQSSAMFIDPSFCNGPCGVGSVWLGVYNSPVDAQSEDNHLVAYRDGEQQQGMPVGTLSALVQTGRCVLIGELATSEYVAILRSDCT